MLKTTLGDLLKISEMELEWGQFLDEHVNHLISKMNENLCDEDIILLNFFFRYDLLLMQYGWYDIAGAHMLITIEDRLRKDILSRNLKLKKSPEDMTLHDMIEILECCYSSDFRNTLMKINRRRSIFIHNNMKNAKKLYNLKNLNYQNEELEHETTRVIVHSTPENVIDLLFLCLRVLRELDSKWIETVKPTFDKFIKDTLERKYDTDL